MADAPAPDLHHFAVLRFRRAFWKASLDHRKRFLEWWLEELRRVLGTVHVYQLTGLRPRSDLLVWASSPAQDPAAPANFFTAWSWVLGRSHLAEHAEVIDTLWGLTRPSVYTGGRDTGRGIDAKAERRGRFLSVYPFVKSAEWYAKDTEERRRVMGDHIQIGRKYPEVDQLLLYAYGLQDQDFVVVYEMDDLARYTELVGELRGSLGRRYTVRDTPISTAVYRGTDDPFAPWLD